MITLDYSDQGRVANVYIDGAEVKNALDATAVDQLRSIFTELRQDENSTSILVLRSKVAGYFCCGMNLNYLEDKIRQSNQAVLLKQINNYAALLKELLELPCVTIAEVDGLTVGGGVDILAGCDLVMASEESAFSIAQLRNRVFPLTTSGMLIPRIGRSAFLYWCLSGQNYDATKLRALGLVNQVLTAEMLPQAIKRFVVQILSYDAQLLTLGLDTIRQSSSMNQSEHLAYLAAQLAHNCRIRAEQA